MSWQQLEVVWRLSWQWLLLTCLPHYLPLDERSINNRSTLRSGPKNYEHYKYKNVYNQDDYQGRSKCLMTMQIIWLIFFMSQAVFCFLCTGSSEVTVQLLIVWWEIVGIQSLCQSLRQCQIILGSNSWQILTVGFGQDAEHQLHHAPNLPHTHLLLWHSRKTNICMHS